MNENVPKSNARSLGAVQERFDIVAPVEDATNIRQPTPNAQNDAQPPDYTTRHGPGDEHGKSSAGPWFDLFLNDFSGGPEGPPLFCGEGGVDVLGWADAVGSFTCDLEFVSGGGLRC